jgi:hypothetical protein
MAIDDLSAILSQSDIEQSTTDPPHLAVEIECDGEFVGVVIDGRLLHRPCRHKRCGIGNAELGERTPEYQRYHVYDVATGEIVRSYDRKRHERA